MPDTLSELRSLAPQELHEETRRSSVALAQSEWHLGLCLRAVELSGLYRDRECSSVVQYAVRYLELDAHKAGELLRVARVLESLALLAEAFRKREVSWSKIREITRVVTPETEEAWLDFARKHPIEAV